MRHVTVLAALPFLCLAGSPVADDSQSILSAVAWTQIAVEHDILCQQVYAAATAAVLAAATGQPTRPRAVIVDVDETVLDNSPMEARLVLDRQPFSGALWNSWCKEAAAAAIPGSLPFAQQCHAHGVTVFYVTNRNVELEECTRQNLRALGFPLDDGDGVDVVMCRGEIDEASTKVGRRAAIMAQFEVVALVGDDLHDFVQADVDLGKRREAVAAHASDWGTRWFVLPNPMYGSWQRAAIGDAVDPVEGLRAALLPQR